MKTSVIVNDNNSIKMSNTLYDLMTFDSVKERGIFKKLDKNNEFSINIIVKYEGCDDKKIKYLVSACRTLQLSSLLAIPNIENTHHGMVEIEVEEVEPIINYDEDDL